MKEETLKEKGSPYICPMHCEGDKVYDKPGNCPVCNMKLVKVEDDHNGKADHHHDDHGQHKHASDSSGTVSRRR